MFVVFNSCVCNPGYTGTFCDSITNICTMNSCLNGGTCLTIAANTQICRCSCGYTGPDCGQQLSFCTGQPCLNGGNCTSAPSACSFRCDCPYGFQGPRCETVLDPCMSNPCANGYCSRQLNQYSYTCLCNPGYTGLSCELMVNLCTDTTCKNYGLCVPTGTSYSCKCLPGYTGTSFNLFLTSYPVSFSHFSGFFQGFDCGYVINQCISNPCFNGGICNSFYNFYNCTCQNGFTGSRLVYFSCRQLKI